MLENLNFYFMNEAFKEAKKAPMDAAKTGKPFAASIKNRPNKRTALTISKEQKLIKAP